MSYDNAKMSFVMVEYYYCMLNANFCVNVLICIFAESVSTSSKHKLFT